MTDLEMAIALAIQTLEETGGTISTEIWSAVVNLTSGASEREQVMRAARAWRHDRGMTETDDFIVGSPAM